MQSYRRTIEAFNDSKALKRVVNHIDSERGIIVYAGVIQEKAGDINARQAFNVKIMKIHSEFEVLTYKENVQLIDAIYNQKEGHLIIL